MLESMFDQETVTRNEILRNRREAAEEAAKKASEEAQTRTAGEIAANMLKNGISDKNVLACSGISESELENLKKKLNKEQQDQLS